MAITIPTKPAELEEMLGDSARMQAVFKDKEAFKGFIVAYATAFAKTDQATIDAQIEEAKKAAVEAVTALLKEQGIKRPLSALPEVGARNAFYNKTAVGVAMDGKFETPAEFLKAIWHREISRRGGVHDERLNIRNDMSGVIGADGGFLVPETLRAELLRISLETAVVRPRARTIPMESLTVPFPVIRDSTHASTVYGGISGTWASESETLTESAPTFGRILLTAKKLTAYTEVPNELIADSIISFEAFINQMFPEALAYFEDDAFLVGDGSDRPLGATHASNPCLIAQAKETGQDASTIVWENLIKIYSRMLPASLGRGVWVANIDTFPQLAVMSLSVGTGGAAIWLNNGVVGPPMSILGRPVIFTEKVENLGDQGDIGFYDFGYYLIGDRQAMSAASSPHFKFQNDQTVYRFIERVDGQPWLQSALTPRKSTTTLSPFVTLAARA